MGTTRAKRKLSELSDGKIKSKEVGKNSKQIGVSPAVVLCDPKFDHNIGMVQRACSCFGVTQLWWTGDRVKLDNGKRLPREERMKGYAEVDLIQFDYPFEQFADQIVPVAIELRPNSEELPYFIHPEKAVYVFGPEDGSIPSTMLRHCHRFVKIPVRHCVNLAMAVHIVLYDRYLKTVQTGAPLLQLAEERGPSLVEQLE